MDRRRLAGEHLHQVKQTPPAAPALQETNLQTSCRASPSRRFEALRRVALQPMGPTLRLIRLLQRRKNTTQVALKFVRPLRSYSSLNTKPGDFAIADATKIMADCFDIWRLKFTTETGPIVLNSS